MLEKTPVCLVCQSTQDQVPLIQLVFKNETYHICPEHFPILIHSPQKLAGILPGAENLKAHEH
jgi:hypothetical protein